MSFVTAIKDYVEFLNNIYDSVSGDFNLLQLGYHTLFYFFRSILFGVQYLLTFQWLRDLSNLPILIPQISSTILRENLILANPSNGFFSFFQIPFFETNKFFIGFLNSFFLSLPFSCSHLIVFRRLIVQGISAAVAASLGTIFGQFLFLATIIFGIRFFLIPWLSFDSIQYLLGLFLILSSVYSMSHEIKLFRVKSHEIFVLLKMFFLNFALAWIEQSCLFQYLGNLTFTSEPTILESFSSKNQVDSFLIHISYLSGIFVGSIVFSFLFCFLAYQLTRFFPIFTGMLNSEFVEKSNFILISAIIGFSLASIPFYGLDYLITKPFGFISQDKALEKTIFYPFQVPNSMEFGHQEDEEPYLEVAPFDRGRYLEPVTNGDSLKNTFEDLNYQGEYAWKGRMLRKASLAKESSDFLVKFLKKSDKKYPSQEFSAMSEETLPFDENSTNEDNDSPKEKNLRELFQKGNDHFLYDHPVPEGQYDPWVEKSIKNKYYSNPVYKKLLQADIDFFLSRQPEDYTITPGEEKKLIEKRLLLANYYDSLRFYKELPFEKNFQEIFQGSRSYADRIYNQQFKGTFNIVRRLFAITGNEEENYSNNRILKYDQPLYNRPSQRNKLLPIFHEELFKTKTEGKPFLESTQLKPFYAGWDNEERKFIITNRFLPRPIAGYKLPLEDKTRNFKTIQFTAWPLSPKSLKTEKNALDQNLPYTFLFQLENENVLDIQSKLDENSEKSEEKFDYRTSLPTNILASVPKPTPSLFDRIAPKRGGYIWPGGYELKMKWSQLKK